MLQWCHRLQPVAPLPPSSRAGMALCLAHRPRPVQYRPKIKEKLVCGTQSMDKVLRHIHSNCHLRWILQIKHDCRTSMSTFLRIAFGTTFCRRPFKNTRVPSSSSSPMAVSRDLSYPPSPAKRGIHHRDTGVSERANHATQRALPTFPSFCLLSPTPLT